MSNPRSIPKPLERRKEMKLSVKFREEADHHHQNPLVRAKIPVTILGLPFLLGIAAGDSSDLSFSLRSNFISGPSLSLSYRPTLRNATQNCPISVCLKSGIGVFGSPQSSPLIFAANFNFFSSSSNPNPNPLIPTFSLHVKPKFGDFSLFKSVSSCDSGMIQTNGNIQNSDSSNGSPSDSDMSKGTDLGSPRKQLSWKDLRSDSPCGGLLSGIFLAAKTCMPLAKRAVVNLRWGVNFPPEQEGKTPLPILVLNKISLQKVDVKKGEEGKKVGGTKWSKMELLNVICGWMRREVEDLQRENREIKQSLEAVRPQGNNLRGRGKEREIGGKRAMSLPENLSNLHGSKGDNRHGESKKSEVEIELEKAIKAAS